MASRASGYFSSERVLVLGMSMNHTHERSILPLGSIQWLLVVVHHPVAGHHTHHDEALQQLRDPSPRLRDGVVLHGIWVLPLRCRAA